MINFCPKCGKQTPNEQSLFCDKCGYSLNATQQIKTESVVTPLIKNNPEIKYNKNQDYEKKVDQTKAGPFGKIVFVVLSTIITYFICEVLSSFLILYGNGLLKLSSSSNSGDISQMENTIGNISLTLGTLTKIAPIIVLLVLTALVFQKERK